MCMWNTSQFSITSVFKLLYHLECTLISKIKKKLLLLSKFKRILLSWNKFWKFLTRKLFDCIVFQFLIKFDRWKRTVMMIQIQFILQFLFQLVTYVLLFYLLLNIFLTQKNIFITKQFSACDLSGATFSGWYYIIHFLYL